MPCLFSSSPRLESYFPNKQILSNKSRRRNLQPVKPGNAMLLATISMSIATSTKGAQVKRHSLAERNDKSSENRVSNSLFHKFKQDKRESSDPIKKFLVGEIKGMPIEEILDFLEKNYRNWTVSDLNDLLLALVMQNEQDVAFELYSCLPKHGLIPDARTFSIMIRCHCKRNEPDEAKRILNRMLESGYHPNVTTFTYLIHSFCKKGKVQKAFEILDAMGKIQCKPTAQTYNCLLKGLCFVGRVEEAYEMLMDIKKENKVSPDIFTYTAVMDGFCKVGRSSEAKELLEEAIQIGCTPCSITYNTLFDGYCREGRPMKGFSVLRLMKQRNCSPDYITYDTFLNGLLKWGKIRPALSVLKEMESIGFEAEGKIINRLCRELCRKSWEEPDLVDDAYQMFDKMSNRKNVSVLNRSTFVLLIRALCMGARFEEAILILERSIKLGFVPSTMTFNNLIQGLSMKGKIEEALVIIVVMYEHGKIPSRTSYDVLINELNRQGRSLAACSVYGAALKQNVVPHWLP